MPPWAILRLRSLNLAKGLDQSLSAASGPMKNPRYSPEPLMAKWHHSGVRLLRNLAMIRRIGSPKTQLSGMITHFVGLSVRAAMASNSRKRA